MAALVHQSLTNSQVLPFRAHRPAPGLLARFGDTLRRWERRSRERDELSRLSERDLRDMRVSSADVWHEIRQPFWRGTEHD